jgi:hypothetical protein
MKATSSDKNPHASPLSPSEAERVGARGSSVEVSDARYIQTFREFCEFLEGAREDPPPSLAFLSSGWFRGLWWGLLIALILLFSGQTSKFIYIDF